MQDIQSRFVNERLPDIHVTTGHDETNFSFVSAVDGSEITIENNSTGNVILQGLLTNPIGTIQIASQRGDIMGADGHQLQANRISLSAPQGAIGDAAALVNVELVQDIRDAQLEVQAGSDAFLGTSVVELLDQPPVGEVILDRVDLRNLEAGGDIQLVQRGARVLLLSAEPGVPPRPIDVAALPTVTSIIAALTTGNYLQGRYAAANSSPLVRDVNEAVDHVFRVLGNAYARVTRNTILV